MTNTEIHVTIQVDACSSGGDEYHDTVGDLEDLNGSMRLLSDESDKMQASPRALAKFNRNERDSEDNGRTPSKSSMEKLVNNIVISQLGIPHLSDNEDERSIETDESTSDVKGPWHSIPSGSSRKCPVPPIQIILPVKPRGTFAARS